MLFAPIPLGSSLPDAEALAADRKTCRRFGPCGAGRKALYLGGRFLDRRYYLPWREIHRVFKRVAMSKNGFTGRGIFGSLPFLVVQYGNGKERECPFKIEADIDRLLAVIEKEHPEIPTHSAQAQQKLARAEAAEKARYLKTLSPDAAETVRLLEAEKTYLEEHPSFSDALVSAARQKRIADNISPAYLAGGTVLAALAALAAAWGLRGLLVRSPYAPYFLLGGAAVFFMTLSANALPGRWNSKKEAQKTWEQAAADMRTRLSERDSFSVPAQYAHPIVLARMIRVVREGRAVTAQDALETVKNDLKALNASVTVSQAEHDEVAAVKPLFLVCGYRDEL